MSTEISSDQNHLSFANESELIQLLYGSLTDKEGFHPFLSQLSHTVGADAGLLFSVNRQQQQLEYLWHHGLAEDFLSNFFNNDMLAHDPIVNLGMRNAPCNFKTAPDAAQMLIEQDNSEHWLESFTTVQQVLGLVDASWIIIHATEESAILMSLQRFTGRDYFSPDEIAPLNKLVPHIRQALQLYHQINQQLQKASSLVGVLDALPNASIVLSDQTEVIHANKAAQVLLANQTGIRLEQNKLVFDDRVFQQDFIIQLQEILRGALGLDKVNASTVFMPRDKMSDLIICLSGIEHIGQSRAGIMLTLYDPEQRQLPSSDLIAKYFDLTKTEAELCRDLVNGLSLKAIAEQKHRSEATIRSHLKQIFKKTGFARQGQLVSSVLAALMY